MAGLYLYDDQGREKFSPATSNVTVLGIVNTGKSNGSVTNPVLAKGTPVIVASLPNDGSNATFNMPKVTASGTTISWTWKQSGANYNVEHRIVYGVRA